MAHVSKGRILDPRICETPGARLAFLRLAVHEVHKPLPVSQDTLSQMSGVSHEVIRRFEHGRQRPKPRTLEALCGALKVPVSLLSLPQDRWLKAVRGLEARILVSGRKDLVILQPGKPSNTPHQIP